MPEGTGSYPWPRLVFWETTAACNLDCSHCRREVGSGASPIGELTTSEAERLVDEIASWGRSVLILSGGEPLLRSDIFHLAERASTQGLIVALASNGTLIDAAVADRIRGAGISRVSISLDGAEAEVHDAFRRQPGAFAAALSGIEVLRKAGVPVQINVTVARHNVGRLNEMVALAKRLGAVALHFFLLVPVGCGLEIAEEQAISPEEYEETLGWLYETEGAEPELQLKATCAPHYFRIARQRRAAHGAADPQRRAAGGGRGCAPRDHPGVSGGHGRLLRLPYREGIRLWLHAGGSGGRAPPGSFRRVAAKSALCRAAGPLGSEGGVRRLRVQASLRRLPGAGIRGQRGLPGRRAVLCLPVAGAVRRFVRGFERCEGVRCR